MSKKNIPFDEAAGKKQGKGQKPPRGKGIDPKLLLRVLKLFIHDYPVHIALAGLCIVISAIVGVMPAIYIENITDIIVRGLEIAKASSVAAAWETVAPEVFSALSVMVVLYLVGLCASVLQQLIAIATQGFLDKMRKRMFEKMQDLPVKFFDATNHGDIMSYYTNDIDTLRQLISQGIPSIITALITLSVLICVMTYFSVSLMIVVIVGVIAMFKVTKFVGGNSAKYFMM